MYNNLTQNQEKILIAIRSFIKRKKFSPTIGELQEIIRKDGLKLKSKNSISQYLNVLERKGFIQRSNKRRNIRVLGEGIKSFVAVPIMGQADCGEALSFAEDYTEAHMNISKSFIKNDKRNYFLIKAMGDSMNKVDIDNGNLVLVEEYKGLPQTNDIVVVVIDGLAIIKKYKEINNEIILYPESTNKKHQPIIIHSDDNINFCGKVVHVFKFSAMEK